MKGSRFLAACLVGILLTGSCFASPILTKRRVLSDLDCLHTMFDVKYAPRMWKGEYANWSLDQEIQNAKNKIANMHNPSLKECQIVVRDFFNSARDYHVGVRFYSTESASLPFLIKGAENRYFVCDVDYGQLSVGEFPFEVGDEILTYNGQPIHEVIRALRTAEFGSNTEETDLSLAEMSLTNRHGAMGHVVPSGKLVISGKKQGDEQQEIVATLDWSYIPEKIRDFSKLGGNITADITPFEWKENFQTALQKSQFFDKFMVFHQWDRSYVGASTQLSKHSLGSRSTYLPTLGKRVWRSGSEWIFDAYIFQTESGKQIGYIRIPHYMCEIEELDEFGEIMNFFEEKTDALVIDQLNNPGGSVFYLYALASIFTDKPLYAPKHHIALTQEEVHSAIFMLPYLEQVKDDASARAVLGEEVGGYPVSFEFVRLMKKFCHFIIGQWEQGHLYTEPTHLFGVDEIKPHPDYRYTKPVLLLVNSLCFSGGDFFPAIMQDNKRATIMGTRTAGAGGYVLTTSFPNHSGIKGFNLTGSLAERIDKKPIENLGVTPDIHYPLTVEDLQNGYRPFAEAIIINIEALTQ